MAEAYYEPTPATDGASMNPVPGAVFQVFEISDTSFTTPLPLRVGAGNPTTTVAASDTLATLPGVYVTSPNFEHHWKSGSFVWRRDSIDGAKGAIERAESSALSAANAAADVQLLAESGAFEGPQGPQGERGLPGPNAVANDVAFAAALTTPGTETNAAINEATTDAVESGVIPVKSGVWASKPSTVPARALHSTGFFYVMGSAAAPQTPSAGTWATNVAYLSSWALDAAVRIDRVGFRVTTPAAAGATADIAIYRNDNRGRPRELVTAVTGIALQTAGAKNQTVDVLLTPGVYWAEVTFHGDVAALVVEALPSQGGFLPVPVSVSGTVPLTGATATGLSRPGRTGVPSAVDSAETLAPTVFVPRLFFRPTVAATPGRATLHDANVAEVSLKNYSQVVTPEHIYIEDDPVLGGLRKTIRMTTHETDTGLTSNPRTQLAPYTTVSIGSEFWASFALYIPESPAFPATWNNSYFYTLAEMYGSPYGGTSPFRFTIVQGSGGISLCATRSTAFSVGTPNVWIKPLSEIRGKWIDIVLHGVLSADPAIGFYELYTNEGNGLVQQQLAGQNRLYGASVVAGINDGSANSFHLKNYRQAGSGVTESTVYFAEHRVGTSLDEVNPHSYS